MAEPADKPVAPAMSAAPTTPTTNETANADTSVQASSPAHSDKTVLPQTAPRQMTAKPRSNAAVFSTNCGLRPRRKIPNPPPPAIVRGSGPFGVFEAASQWRIKFPHYYHCFFPGEGWEITDLWDDADIHIDSPDFLRKVLFFIGNDNVIRVQNFVAEWSPQHKDKMILLNGNIDHLFDSNDRLSIVEKIFTEDETEQYPRRFLWEALCVIRQTFRVLGEKFYEDNVTSAQLRMVTGGPELAMEKLKSLPKPSGQAIAVGSKPTPSNSSSQGISPPKEFQGPDPNILLGSYTAATPSGAPATVPSGPNLPPVVHPMEQPAAMMPTYGNEQLHNPKKPMRSGSGPWNQASNIHGWGDNVHVVSGEYLRAPSGPFPGNHGQKYIPSLPMGSSMMNMGPAFPPNHPLTSSPMGPAPVHFVPIMGPPAPYGPPLPDQDLRNIGPRHRVGPFVDMTNSMQYPPGRSSNYHNVMDNRNGMTRRNSQPTKILGLYNPYGAERPDKADFATFNGRKGSRQGVPSNVGRNRKLSSGSFNRVGYGLSEADRSETHVKSHINHYNDGVAPLRSITFQADSSIINDLIHGCSENFIGPQNDTVNQLYVRNMPGDVKKDEIRGFFVKNASVHPSCIEMRYSLNQREVTHAFIIFNSTEEARKGLEANGARLRDFRISISVARRHFAVHGLGVSPRSVSRPSQGACHDPRLVTQSLQSAGDKTEEPSHSIQYSPQDARSDLPRMDQHQDKAATHGSPEQKAKKNPLPIKPAANEAEKKPTIQEFPTSSIPVEEVEASVQQHVPSITKETSTEAGDTLQETVFVDSDSAECEKTERAKSPAIDTLVDKSAPGSPSKLALRTTDREHQTRSTAPGDFVKHSDNKELPHSPNERPQETEKQVVEPSSKADKKTGRNAENKQTQDENGSDDDQKNDLSFHSAQELQLEIGNDTIQGSVQDDDRDEHTFPPTSALDGKKTDEGKIGEEKIEDQTQPLCTDITPKEHETAAPENAVCEEDSTKDVASAFEQGSAAEAGRKQGAQRTESLFPFAKPAKSQAKKDRLAKKKEKRKEKGRAKNEKTPVAVVVGTKPAMNPEDLDLQPRPPKNSPSDQPEEEQVADTLVKPAKGEVSDEPIKTMSMREPQDPDDEISKQSQGKLNPQSPKTGPTTQTRKGGYYGKMEEDHKAPINHGVPGLFPVPAAASSETNGTAAVEMEPSKKLKVVPSMIAVPSLDLLKKKSSPTNAMNPPDTAYYSFSSPSGTASPTRASTKDTASVSYHPAYPVPTKASVSGSFGMATKQDSASVASSSTLRGLSPPPESASPTTVEFHTPAQTPTISGPQTGEVNKRKKNKRKKKAAKPTATSEEGTHDQMGQTANVRTGYDSFRDEHDSDIKQTHEDKVGHPASSGC